VLAHHSVCISWSNAALLHVLPSAAIYASSLEHFSAGPAHPLYCRVNSRLHGILQTI
jgi:hypothetical protein